MQLVCIIDVVSKNDSAYRLVMVVGRSTRTISRQEAPVLVHARAARIRNSSKKKPLPYAPDLLTGLITNRLFVILSRADI